MKFKLLCLSIENFKGQTRTVHFFENTQVFGANGTGKTTLYDAFTWLLFGKDSLGRKDYNIKPRLTDSSEAQRVEVSVYGEFEVNGEPLTLKRIYTENWKTKKGSDVEEFTNNDTTYEINGVACNMTNYKKQIASFIEEELFKLITSTDYFQNMKWQDRRSMLLAIAGEPTNEEVAGQDNTLLNLLNEASGKKLEQFKQELAARKKPIKKQRDEIPGKIEENKRDIIEKDWISLENEIKNRQNEITRLEKQIDNEALRIEEANKEVNQKAALLQKEISNLSNEKFSIEQKHKEAYNKALFLEKNLKEKLSGQILLSKTRLQELEKLIQAKQKEVDEKYNSRKNLSDKYDALKDGNGVEKVCPACGSVLTEDILHRRIGAMVEEVLKTATHLKEEHNRLKAELDILVKEKEALPDKITNLETQVNALLPVKHHVSICQEDESYKMVLKQLSSKKEELDMLAEQAVTPNDLSAVKERINLLRKDINSLNQELYQKQIAEGKEKRNAELEAEYKRLSIEYATVEKLEMAISRFTKKKLSMMEEKINSLFSLVKWKMYRPLINGGEEEICECTINGVPYSSSNTASKINAGLDIINTFSRLYDAYAPIFIDSRESVTEIIPVNTQVISLIVSPEHKELTIK